MLCLKCWLTICCIFSMDHMDWLYSWAIAKTELLHRWDNNIRKSVLCSNDCIRSPLQLKLQWMIDSGLSDTTSISCQLQHSGRTDSQRCLQDQMYLQTLMSLLTFTGFAVRLKGESHRAAAAHPRGCVFTCPVTAPVIYSAGLYKIKQKTIILRDQENSFN